ncbi:MAG: transposase [Candidatus Marinimicrobia bacterium]|nr:transposase [Candidatus Neomarinimicrobiota bacterium]MCF7851533.1 transposase [Candidatus Neomarinimicrobiota bacterium]MCF7904897.1 transposase [Candidatus Neomarinimicrobiota bacterium]
MKRDGKYRGLYRVASSRLHKWDYRSNSAYFVTICTKGSRHFFGHVTKGQIQLSEIGKIAQEYWREIPKHFRYVDLDAFVIMPNHVHGIIIIDRPRRDVACNVSTKHHPSTAGDKRMSSISPKPGSLSTIIRSYKSAVTRDVRKIDPNFTWQARFHDQVIRDPEQHERIRQYILNNPTKWDEKQQ